MVKCPCGRLISDSQSDKMVFYVCHCGREYQIGNGVKMISDFLPRLYQLYEEMKNEKAV